MGFFDKLFKKKSRENVIISSGPLKLNLKYKITPENGPNFANQFINAVKQIYGTELDFSPGTIEFVDTFLQKLHNTGEKENGVPESVFMAGCYVGQVIVNNMNGQWVSGNDSASTIAVKLPNNNMASPIAKAFKRFHNGNIDSLVSFYQVFLIHSTDTYTK